MVHALLFIAGLALLIKGADWLVGGSSSIAKRFGISNLAIGLTVVAFGTSAPELVVSMLASVSGASDIAIGNILGSNIANILLILGISAIIFPLAVTKGTVWKEIPLSLLAVLVLAALANDALLDGKAFSDIGRGEGLTLIGFLCIFLAYILVIARQGNGDNDDSIVSRGVFISSAMTLGGLACLVVGGKFVVDSAVALAEGFGVSEALIGLTIVAIGTSLPELATSAVAAYRKNADIAIGNIVGSNIFNVFFVLGLSGVVNPLVFSPARNFDIGMAVLATLLLFIFMFIGKRHTLERRDGILFIILYIAYVAYLVVQG